jgi:hypothetical protein
MFIFSAFSAKNKLALMGFIPARTGFIFPLKLRQALTGSRLRHILGAGVQRFKIIVNL